MSVAAISMPATETREKAVETAEAVDKDDKETKSNHLENLAWVLCIWYSITFWKKSVAVSVLFDLISEVNAIYPAFAWELKLFISQRTFKCKKSMISC